MSSAIGRKLLKKVKYILMILVALITAFTLGSFTPNSMVISNIEDIEHRKSVVSAQKLGLLEPRFEYTDDKTFVEAVYKCIDYLNYTTMPEKRIPSGLIVAMAGIESGWGTSRFANEGNALFGVRTWSLDTVPHMKPKAIPEANFGVKKYKTKCQSVKDVVRILNSHPAYKEFRKERDRQYKGNFRNWDTLVPLIAPWSTTEEYGDIILSTIKKRGF